MADIYKIKEAWMGAWVRSGPGTGYSKLSVIYGKDNQEYQVTERANNYWLKIGEGQWVCDRDSNGMIVMVQVSSESVSEPVYVEPEPPLEQQDQETISYVPDYKPIKFTEQEFLTALENNFSISTLSGIFGMPYQFMPLADPRILMENADDDDIKRLGTDGQIGRKYAREIVGNMPLLLMTAGKPVFMGGYSNKDRRSIIDRFTSIFGELANAETQLNETVLSKDFGKYYTLEYAYTDYFNYVSPMCRTAAVYMNLHDKVINGHKLGWTDWAQTTNKSFNKIFTAYTGCTAWYCNSETSIQDSWTNNTTSSMLADKINSVSEYGRELNFLLGTVKDASKGTALDAFVNMGNEFMENKNNMQNFISKTLGNNKISGIFNALVNGVETVAAGGKIVFPEIWSDSSFSRSYSVNLKLVSPDGDDLSIYLNIIVPILHLMAFVLPRESKPHGYHAPFLVRAFYKGLFNVDMGIITDMTIDKGKEAAWNASGVPLTVDVSFTIKDLYNDMYMTSMEGIKYNMMNNIILMDYIGNLCGININEVDIYRGLNLFFVNNGNKILDTWRVKIYGKMEQFISNKWQSIFGKF